MELITAPQKDQVFSKRPENRIKGTSEELPLSPLIQLLLSGRLTGITSTSLVGAGRGGGGKTKLLLFNPSLCFSTSLLSLPKIKQKKGQGRSRLLLVVVLPPPHCHVVGEQKI